MSLPRTKGWVSLRVGPFVVSTDGCVINQDTRQGKTLNPCDIRFPYCGTSIPLENLLLHRPLGKEGEHVANQCQSTVTVHPAESTCTIWCSAEMYEMWEGLWNGNEHIRRALCLLSLPWGPFLHYFRAFGRERVKYKLVEWLRAHFLYYWI